ncbi:3',5'-cyclic-nucleotide phosphodiesterase [Dispira simplex]|nr:3',5'-cyclic-nucleotide phosphodiesterase [Dispira simplex]
MPTIIVPKAIPSIVMNPSACSIIIVDSACLASSYHWCDSLSDDDEASECSSRPTTANSSTVTGLPPTPLSPPSTPPHTPTSSATFPKFLTRVGRSRRLDRKQPHSACKRECHGASHFIQLLLDTYHSVTAVTAGDAVFSCLQTRSTDSNTAVLLLIDLDHLTPSYNTPTDEFPRCADEPVYGLQLLKLVCEYIEQHSLTSVVPIVMSCRRDPELMRQSLLLGALDYLIKPVSVDSVKSLWLNSVRSKYLRQRSSNCLATPTAQRLSVPVPQLGYSPTSQKDGKTAFDDAWLESSVVEAFTPHALFSSNQRPPFPSMQGPGAESHNATLRARLLDWECNPYDLNDDDLLRSVYLILKEALDASHLHMPDSIIHAFILIIHKSYYANAYHNFHHAVDVLQATYCFLKRSGLMTIGSNPTAATQSVIHQVFQVHDIFAMVIAAIGHDLGHPGVNNHFMTTCRSPLASLYQHKAILENFHASALCQIMKRCGFNLSRYNPGFNDTEFHQVVVQTILATDMASHFVYIDQIRDLAQRCAQAESRRQPLVLNSDRGVADRITVCSALLKCADISNVTRPFHVAGCWTNLLNEEMTKQCDLERKLGFPMSVQISPDTLASSQVGFYRSLALPLFEAVADLLSDLDYCVKNLLTNIQSWEAVQMEQQRRQAVQKMKEEKRKQYEHSWTKNPHSNYSASLARLHSMPESDDNSDSSSNGAGPLSASVPSLPSTMDALDDIMQSLSTSSRNRHAVSPPSDSTAVELER